MWPRDSKQTLKTAQEINIDRHGNDGEIDFNYQILLKESELPYQCALLGDRRSKKVQERAREGEQAFSNKPTAPSSASP